MLKDQEVGTLPLHVNMSALRGQQGAEKRKRGAARGREVQKKAVFGRKRHGAGAKGTQTVTRLAAALDRGVKCSTRSAAKKLGDSEFVAIKGLRRARIRKCLETRKDWRQ